MLGKIIKNELKNSWFEVAIISGIIIVMGLLCSLTSRINSDFIYVSNFVTLILTYIAGCIIIVIDIVSSFYKKVFSDEGYLTLTLPVTNHQLLIGKLLSSIIWLLSIGCSIIISLSIVIALGSDQLNQSFFLTSNINIPFVVSITDLVSIFVTIIFFFVSLFFILALLNCIRLRKFKIIVGIILYYVTYQILSILKEFATVLPFSLYYSYESNSAFVGVSDNPYTTKGQMIIHTRRAVECLDFNSCFWVLIALFGLYFITSYIIKNKVELE